MEIGAMEITVKMTPYDFMEFMEWKKDKTASEKALREVGKNLESLAGMVLKTLEECGKGDEPEFRIESQRDAAKLVEAAYEVF